jgi:integrase-like protein
MCTGTVANLIRSPLAQQWLEGTLPDTWHAVSLHQAEFQLALINDWIPDDPVIHPHFTPTSCSWLNLVECFFSILTRQAIRRGIFTSVADLTAAIEAYIDDWNNHPEPLTWTKTADELPAKIGTPKTKQRSYRPLAGSRRRISG